MSFHTSIQIRKKRKKSNCFFFFFLLKSSISSTLFSEVSLMRGFFYMKFSLETTLPIVTMCFIHYIHSSCNGTYTTWRNCFFFFLTFIRCCCFFSFHFVKHQTYFAHISPFYPRIHVYIHIYFFLSALFADWLRSAYVSMFVWF